LPSAGKIGIQKREHFVAVGGGKTKQAKDTNLPQALKRHLRPILSRLRRQSRRVAIPLAI
jgi:hypothetical protein